jgi:hypothetical protein
MAPTTIDELMPRYDAANRHGIVVDASLGQVWRAAREADLLEGRRG